MSDRLTLGWWVATLVPLLALFGSLIASPDRYVLLIPAAVGVVLAAFDRRAESRLLLLLPWLVLANRGPLRGGGGGMYASEALLLAAWTTLALRRRRPSTASPPWAMAAFSAWIIVAALAALPQGGVEVLWRPFRLACLAWAGYELARAVGDARVLLRSALAWVGALGAVSLAEVAGGWGSRVPEVGRLVGGSELLAIHLTLWFPLGLAAAVAAAGAWMARWGSWLAVTSGAFALIASYSRSGWVGGFVGTLVVLGCLSRFERRRIAGVLLVAMLMLAALAALVAVSGWSPPGVPAAYVERLETLARSGLFADRSEEWQRAVPVLRNAPLFGSPSAPNCYNLMLGLASRHGLPILVPFVALVVMAATGAWRGRRQQGTGAAGVLGALTGLLVTGIGEASLGARVMPEAMAVLGVGSALAAGARSLAKSVHDSETAPLGEPTLSDSTTRVDNR